MTEAVEYPGYLQAMKRFAVFSGRATRSEFWLFTLVSGLITLLASILDGAARTGSVFYICVALLHLIPSIAVFVRRLHDTNRSGWLYLLLFTLIGAIPLLVFLCERGTVGSNHYGSAVDMNLANASLVPLPGEAVAQVGANQVANSIGEIERLAELKARGVLSDSEFEALKGKILGGPASGRVEPRF